MRRHGRTQCRHSKPFWPARVTPPKGAPNSLLILIDYEGFGPPSTFAGVIPTPTLDKVAAEGLRYANFHSTSLCSATRAALITGRSHHSVGFRNQAARSTKKYVFHRSSPQNYRPRLYSRRAIYDWRSAIALSQVNDRSTEFAAVIAALLVSLSVRRGQPKLSSGLSRQGVRFPMLFSLIVAQSAISKETA